MVFSVMGITERALMDRSTIVDETSSLGIAMYSSNC
jgi:hypothetical protein